MSIPFVSVGEKITADLMNKIITGVNASRQDHRNFLLNSNFDYCQRSDTGFFITPGFTVDRWRAETLEGGDLGQTWGTHLLETTLTYIARESTNGFALGQALIRSEVDQLQGEPVVFSVGAFDNADTGGGAPLTLRVQTAPDSNEDASTTWTTISTITVNLTETPEFYDTPPVIIPETALGVRVQVSADSLPIGGNIVFGKPKLEINYTRSPWNLQSPNAITERHACDYYYHRFYAVGAATRVFSGVAATDSSWSTGSIILPTEMRDETPTVSLSGVFRLSDGSAVHNVGSFSFYPLVSGRYPAFQATSSGLTPGRTYFFEGTSEDDWVALEAELR